jgi:hypothetical protein
MKSGIEFSLIYYDDDLLELCIRASNGIYSGETKVYCSHDIIQKIKKALIGFPKSNNDSREFEIGSVSSEDTSGGAVLNFYCVNKSAHTNVHIQIQRNSGDSLNVLLESSSFNIKIEASTIDSFIKELEDIGTTIGATAFIKSAT